MKLGRNQAIAIIVVAVVLCAGVGVVWSYSQSSDKDTGLVFAVGNKDCYEPCWIADEMGYYEKNGVNVDTLTVSGGGKALEALLSGQADIAGFGSTPLVNCLNNNSSGDYVVLARWMGGESYAELASTIFKENNELYSYSLYYPNGSDGAVTVTLHDNSQKDVTMKPIKGSNITIGLDITTGYDAALIKYCSATGLTYAYEGDANAASADIVMKPVEFSLQVAALTQTHDVDGLVGGSYGLAAYFVSNDVILSSPNVEEYPSLESEATCCLIASADAYANKYDEIVGVLKALQEACCYIYGIDYTTDILTKEYVQDAQNKLTDKEKQELFGTTTATEKGYYYRTDACSLIADVFGYPFTTDVQRLSYDNYTWGVDFELVDMKIIKNSYNVYSSNDPNKYREVSGIDYMEYFDGRALSDALKDRNGNSSWNSDAWFVDASTYLCTEYSIKLFENSNIHSIYLNVKDGIWSVQFLDNNGKAVNASISGITMNGKELTEGWTYENETLEFQCVITGNVVISATF